MSDQTPMGACRTCGDPEPVADMKDGQCLACVDARLFSINAGWGDPDDRA